MNSSNARARWIAVFASQTSPARVIAASGGDVATSGVAAVLFGGILYLVLQYVAQPWGYFSHSEGARRLFLGVPILLAVGGLIAIVVGLVTG